MKKIITALFCCLLLMINAVFCYGADAPSDPMLRIETGTGMHVGAINDMAVDSQGVFFATVSDDKTARLWSTDKGEYINVLRPPISKNEDGKLFAVAISPDSASIAMSGCTGAEWDKNISIYIYDYRTSAMKQRITDLPDFVLQLAYSKNNKYLVACLASGGIRVYSAQDYKLITGDNSFNGASTGVDFSNDGKLVVTGQDGFIRLYSSTLKLLKKEEGRSGKKIGQAKFSTDGTKVAIGYLDARAVDIYYSGDTLALKQTLSTPGSKNEFLSCVDWSPDDMFVYAAGVLDKCDINQILKWEISQGKIAGSFNASSDSITKLISLQNGNLLFCSAKPSWGIMDANGKTIKLQESLLADYRDSEPGILINDTASEISFSYERGNKERALFSMADRVISPAVSTKRPLNSPKTVSKKIKLTNWKNKPEINGKPLVNPESKPAIDKREVIQSMAIMPDDSGFVLGSHLYLHFFDAGGVERWKEPAWGSTWSVNIAKNNKVLVAAFHDGTIRWYRVADGMPLLSFLPPKDGTKWILWTQSGFYDTSVGAEKILGWHVNRGKDKEADFYSIGRFRDTKYRPDVVAGVLNTLDEGAAIKNADIVAANATQRPDIKQNFPPVVKIISPANYSRITNNEVAITYIARSENGAPIKGVKAYLDGRPISISRDLLYDESTPQTPPPPVGAKLDALNMEQVIKIPIPSRDVTVSLVAENEYGCSDAAVLKLTWEGQKETAGAVAGTLYLVAVGVSKYRDERNNLNVAAQDALSFADTMSQQVAAHGGLYMDVQKRVLTDYDATKANIIDSLNWLKTSATAKDTTILFLAGHGISLNSNNYFFVPTDTVRINGRLNEDTMVHFSHIKNMFNSIKGNVVFFIDTCHSGNIAGGVRGFQQDNTGIINELSDDNVGAVVIYAASRGNQKSIEQDDWGHGAFTKVLIEGLNGGADPYKSGFIVKSALEGYLAINVAKLTEGQQNPVTASPRIVEDFRISKNRQ